MFNPADVGVGPAVITGDGDGVGAALGDAVGAAVGLSTRLGVGAAVGLATREGEMVGSVGDGELEGVDWQAAARTRIKPALT
jgi:hypothetical protein